MKKLIYFILLYFISGMTAAQQPKPEEIRLIIKANHEHMDPVFTCGKQDHHRESLLNIIVSIWQDQSGLPDYSGCKFMRGVDSVYLATRSGGDLTRQLWSKKPDTIQDVVEFAQKFKTALGEGKTKNTETIELHLSHTYSDVDYQDVRKRQDFLSNIHRGITGIELAYDKILERYPATYVIRKNREHQKLVQLFLERHKLKENDLGRKVRVRSFYADQYMIVMGAKPTIHAVFRGNELISIDEVTQENVRKWIQRSSDWLLNNVHEDGRLTYKYFPSQRRESDSNNMIRQWMASIALTQIASRNANPFYMEQAEKNIDYNLRHFYHEEGELGIIEFEGKVKLGALALAALALVEHPKREKWKREEKALLRTILSMWNEDGSFTGFLRPEGYGGGAQNFYPGEALLLWAVLYEKEKDAALLMRFMKSFEYYRAWHLVPNNRNPAFVPWHTQAYYIIWKLIKNDELKDFIFTMNDWLIDVMQQWREDSPYGDVWGRFYSADHPYGPPHASSTGVYLEGLIDAYKLAKAVGDKKRVEKYRIAILRGIRSQMQLQFVNDVDMFYLPKPERKYVYGGLRTTVYHNEVRCDNIQHGLMGIFKIADEFKPGDYKHIE